MIFRYFLKSGCTDFANLKAIDERTCVNYFCERIGRAVSRELLVKWSCQHFCQLFWTDYVSSKTVQKIQYGTFIINIWNKKLTILMLEKNVNSFTEIF